MPVSVDPRRARSGRLLRELRPMLAIFGCILLAALIVGGSGEPRAARSGLVAVAAPDFTATGMDGARVRLQDLRGRPVWLNFLSSWCTACRSENPDIEAIDQEQRRNGGDVVVLGIGVNETVASVGEYARNAGLTFSMAADPDGSISRRYSVLALPTHVFVDREGIIREIRIGALEQGVMRQLVGGLEKSW